MNLPTEQQRAAKTFIFDHARPLERSLYRFHFENAAPDDALAELAAFQNPDGGFGHGLEPDIQLADSSAVVTTVGLQHLRALGAGSSDPLVQRAIQYLLATYDPSIQTWQIIPANIDDAPHAPWWAYDDTLAQRWRGFLANPRAEIVGYFYEHAALVPAPLLRELGAATATHLEGGAELEMHDLLCYVRLAQTAALPGDLRARLLDRLLPACDEMVARDPGEWAEYGLQPLKVAESPDSPFAALLAGALPANLDYLIRRQGEDGAWAPDWSWYGLYDEAWPAAERAWKGVLTLNALRQLRAFGRLSGPSNGEP
jgi:hypothetical protein